MEERNFKLLIWDGNAWTDAAVGAYVYDSEKNLVSVEIGQLGDFVLFYESTGYKTYLPIVAREED